MAETVALLGVILGGGTVLVVWLATRGRVRKSGQRRMVKERRPLNSK